MKKDREIRKSIKTVVMVENLVKGSEGKEDERIFLKENYSSPSFLSSVV